MGPPGFHTTVREPKRAHVSPALQTPPKFHERTPEREEQNEFCGGRGKKKSEILGGPGKGGPGRTEHDQTKTLKPPHGNRETNTPHKHTQTHTNTHKHKSKSVWPKLDWPKSAMTGAGEHNPADTLTPGRKIRECSEHIHQNRLQQ